MHDDYKMSQVGVVWKHAADVSLGSKNLDTDSLAM